MLAKFGASRALPTAASQFLPCESFKTGSPQVAGMGEAKWDTASSAAESAQSLVLQWYPNSRRHVPQEQRSACVSQVPPETWKRFLFLQWGKEGPKSVSTVALSTDPPNLNVLRTNCSLETTPWVTAAAYWQQLWPPRMKATGSPEQGSARMPSF